MVAGPSRDCFDKKGAAAPEMPPLVRPQPGPANAPTDPSPGADDHVTEPIPFERTPIEPCVRTGGRRARAARRRARRRVVAVQAGAARAGPRPDRPPDAVVPRPAAGHRCTGTPGSSRCATRRAASARPRPPSTSGAALAEFGRKVLLVDFDPQGSLSVGLGLNPHEMDLTVYNLLMQRDVDPRRRRRADRACPAWTCCPPTSTSRPPRCSWSTRSPASRRWPRVLAPAIATYDVILIDCQPSLGLLTVNALTASDGVIVPLECEYFALRGVALLKTTIDKVRERLNPKLEIDGVLGTMFDGRTLHGREVMERLVQAWGDMVFHTVIRRTVKFSDSTVAGEPITSYATTSPGADAYRQLAKEVALRCLDG